MFHVFFHSTDCSTGYVLRGRPIHFTLIVHIWGINLKIVVFCCLCVLRLKTSKILITVRNNKENRANVGFFLWSVTTCRTRGLRMTWLVIGRPRQLRALKMSHIVFWSRNVTSQGRVIVPTRHAVSIVVVQQCVLQPAVELTRCFYDALCFTTSHGMPLLCHTTRCVVCLHKYAFVASHKILKLCHTTRRRAHTTISWQHKKAFLKTQQRVDWRIKATEYDNGLIWTHSC